MELPSNWLGKYYYSHTHGVQLMKIVFQLIDSGDGKRSEPACLTRKELADLLIKFPPGPVDLIYVLVLHEFPEGAEDWQISRAPLMTVRYFCSGFSGDTNPFPEQPIPKTSYRDWYGNFPPDEAGDNRTDEVNNHE